MFRCRIRSMFRHRLRCMFSCRLGCSFRCRCSTYVSVRLCICMFRCRIRNMFRRRLRYRFSCRLRYLRFSSVMQLYGQRFLQRLFQAIFRANIWKNLWEDLLDNFETLRSFFQQAYGSEKPKSFFVALNRHKQKDAFISDLSFVTQNYIQMQSRKREF